MPRELSEALVRRKRLWGAQNAAALREMRIELKNPSRYAYLSWRLSRKRISIVGSSQSAYFTRIPEAE